MIHTGDCIEVMAAMAADSVDAVVTDPPYGLPGGFMGKSWDHFAGKEDAGFAYWLAGLIDGEGHFAIKKHSRGTHAPYFALKMRADEEGTLRSIERHLRIGTITYEERDPNPLVKWVVQDKEGCQRLVDLLDKYPLRAKKRLDYDIWREAVCEWTDRARGNRWHGGTDNTRMEALRTRIMAVRRYVDPAWSGNEYQDWSRLWGTEAIRVLKPGGWLLAFGGTRAYHRMVAGLEDAGFEIRDTLQHIYASGFPKGKANLKPAHEPIVLARKPGPLRPLAIDECRIPTTDDLGVQPASRAPNTILGKLDYNADEEWRQDPAGRWPSNLLLSDPELFDQPNPYVVGSGAVSDPKPERNGLRGGTAVFGQAGIGSPDQEGHWPEDMGGGYSRFFIVPKADRGDREPVLRGQVPEGRVAGRNRADGRQWDIPGSTLANNKPNRENQHPTVKPTDLMRHLVRLVTPTGGTVLDCFLGSGSTAIAAELEGFAWVGIEKEPEYVAIAEARLNGTQRGLGLDVPAPTKAPPKTHPDLSKHQPKQRAAAENYSGAWAGTPPDEEPAA